MKNIKALMATEQVEAFTTLFDNPEITAMAAISEILKELPDEAARMRVMRWTFGRFSEEFKRPLHDAVAASAPSAVVQAAPIVHAAPVAPVMTAPVVMAPAPVAVTVTPEPEYFDPVAEKADFARQISELQDLFPRSRGFASNSFA
jgi:hypothetical protein